MERQMCPIARLLKPEIHCRFLGDCSAGERAVEDSGREHRPREPMQVSGCRWRSRLAEREHRIAPGVPKSAAVLPAKGGDDYIRAAGGRARGGPKARAMARR